KLDEFYEQIAVAYGIGLRLNFDYFVLRFDMGMKAVNPAYENGKEHFPIVNISVQNFLSMDSIGKAGRMTDEASFRLNAQIQNGKWRIRMEGPLRSEKRSRD
ncbi:MAG: hypothetical protein IKZ93_06300, partial [Prevotella sp.]|nr:hypothetical protein [Prevotella sp.]